MVKRRPFNKEAWMLAAMAHDDFADALMWLADRSLSLQIGEAADRSTPEPNTYLVTQLVSARSVVEGAIGLQANGLECEHVEMRRLIHTIIRWSMVMQQQSRECLEIAAAITPGRPRRPRSMASGGQDPPGRTPLSARRGPGRPPAVKITDEQVLEILAKSSGSGESDIQLLRTFAEQYLQERGQHSVGGRVERIASNLQKRASAAKAKVRKFGEKVGK